MIFFRCRCCSARATPKERTYVVLGLQFLVTHNNSEVGPTPTVTVTPANSSVLLNGIYTLAMVDADIVGSKLPDGQTRHWLVNGVTISGTLSSIIFDFN